MLCHAAGLLQTRRRQRCPPCPPPGGPAAAGRAAPRRRAPHQDVPRQPERWACPAALPLHGLCSLRCAAVQVACGAPHQAVPAARPSRGCSRRLPVALAPFGLQCSAPRWTRGPSSSCSPLCPSTGAWRTALWLGPGRRGGRRGGAVAGQARQGKALPLLLDAKASVAVQVCAHSAGWRRSPRCPPRWPT